jgi:hypothetical protein
MESIIGALKDTPIPTILVVAGIVFLLLSIAGQLAGRITVPPEQRRWAAVMGGGLLAIGLALHIVPLLQPSETPPPVKEVSPSGPPMPPAKEMPPAPSGGILTPQSPPEPSAPATTEEKEPNDDSASATVIPEGTTVHGLLGKDHDQAFFRFHPSGHKTRVVVRTKPDSPLVLMVTVYDHVENLLVMQAATVYRPATFAFESIPGSRYYIMVKASIGSIHGKYEIIVRQE